MMPEDLKYTETHEWVKTTGKNIAIVGITDYAVEQLKDIVHLDLPKVGAQVEHGSPFGEIESVKTVEDLVAPVSGKITEVNKEVLKDLDILKNDPYEDGWLIKLKMTDPSELDVLMSASEYKEFVETQEEEGGEEVNEEGENEEDADEEYFM